MKQTKYDLEDRTTEFAKRIIGMCKVLPKNAINDRLVRQIVGSSGSVGANYREANDALGKKDFIHRLKISRKEAKETVFWLDLIEEANLQFKEKMKETKQEALEIRNIFSAIIRNVENKK